MPHLVKITVRIPNSSKAVSITNGYFIRSVKWFAICFQTYRPVRLCITLMCFDMCNQGVYYLSTSLMLLTVFGSVSTSLASTSSYFDDILILNSTSLPFALTDKLPSSHTRKRSRAKNAPHFLIRIFQDFKYLLYAKWLFSYVY